MVKRILMDINGMKVSKPGFNVETAGPFDLLFGSAYKTPKLIMKGTIVVDPSYQAEAAGEYLRQVLYGTTYDPVPYVVAVGRFTSSYNNTNGRYQYGYLNNQWHTPVIEYPSTHETNVYGGRLITRGQNVPYSWASYKFTVTVLNDRLQFRVNNVPSGLTIKYAVLDIN